MKRFIEGEDRRQVTLLPECLDDYIGEVLGAIFTPTKLMPGAVAKRLAHSPVPWPLPSIV